MIGELFVVATPIGNLHDMVPRAIDVLQSVDLIAAENPRHSSRLLAHFGITTKMTAYHDHSEKQQLSSIVTMLREGQNVALISDAGTPLVSDPGYRLIRQARDNDIKVTPIPGACAAIAALSAAGLPSDRFLFEGFPPAKKSARKNSFEALKQDPRTLIFYEAPHRIAESLHDMCATFGSQREAVIGREITKTFETFLSGSLEELHERVQQDSNQQRGEIVVMVKGASETLQQNDREQLRVLSLLLKELPLKKAAALTAEITGGNKKVLYQIGVTIKAGDPAT